MEKYGQYRDKGSGIAPFFPIASTDSGALLLPWHLFLFCIRIPLLTVAWMVWLGVIQWLPAGSFLRKANQWCVLGIPGVWWIDLQVDGVRRGSLAQSARKRLPYPGTIIAASFTSPLDVLYLAAIFDPVFTQSSPDSQLVRPISLESALAACFSITNPLAFGLEEKTTSLEKLVKRNPNRIIVVFPEATASNGRGILRLSPALLSAASDTKIFPVSLRYTPADVVTPIPGWVEAARFIWRLNSRQTHCIRVRIGTPLTLATPPAVASISEVDSPASKASPRPTPPRNGYGSNFFDTLQASPTQNGLGAQGDVQLQNGSTDLKRRALDAVADGLARLGRVKRVNLGVEEKAKFVEAWTKGRKGKR